MLGDFLKESIEEPTMTWWIWMLAGLGLLALEILIPGGIIFLFFGVSAMVVGALVAVGIGGPVWVQALIFSVMSVVSLLTLRSPILRRMEASSRAAGSGEVDSLVGKDVQLAVDIAAHGEGTGELRGTSWTVKNLGDSALSRGDKRVVERVDGLTLFVR